MSDTTKTAHPKVPWRDIVGTRIILAHAYFHIDDAIVGQVIHRDIPVLRTNLREIIASVGEA